MGNLVALETCVRQFLTVWVCPHIAHSPASLQATGALQSLWQTKWHPQDPKHFPGRLSLFKIVLVIQSFLRFHMNFRMDFSISLKKYVTGILTGIALNLKIPLGGLDILMI